MDNSNAVIKIPENLSMMRISSCNLPISTVLVVIDTFSMTMDCHIRIILISA